MGVGVPAAGDERGDARRPRGGDDGPDAVGDAARVLVDLLLRAWWDVVQGGGGVTKKTHTRSSRQGSPEPLQEKGGRGMVAHWGFDRFCAPMLVILAIMRLQLNSSQKLTAKENTSVFSLYGSRRNTSGAMYMSDPVLPVSWYTSSESVPSRAIKQCSP